MSAVTVATGPTSLSAFRPGAFALLECVAIRTAAGAETWDNTYKPIQCVDPGGSARTFKLPPEEDGLWFLIVNKADAAETITIQNDAAGAIGTITQDQSILLSCDGTTWRSVCKVASILTP
jgi:hypothetical protein